MKSQLFHIQSRANDRKRTRYLPLFSSSTEHSSQMKLKVDNIPEEVWLRIFSLVAESTSQPERTDPFHLGWRDEAEIFSEARQRLAELGPIRLVSRHFLHLSTPLYFQKVVVGKQYNRLPQLLAASPPPPYPNGLVRGQYGQYVRDLLIGITDPHAVTELLHAIYELIPHVIQLSSLRLSHLSSLLSPSLSFPELQSLSELSAEPVTSPTSIVCRHSPTLQPIAVEENFLSLVNHHPLLRRLSCRGFRINSNRFINILRSSLLSVPLLGHLKSVTVDFEGLQSLHFGLDCVLDLELLQLLPSAAPALEKLHIDAGCRIEDSKDLAHTSDNWSLFNLVGALPKLTEFSFIGRQSLPNSETNCWETDDILEVGKALKLLNLRVDSIGPGILSRMQQLECLNVWHSPSVYGYEGWGIVSIDEPDEVGTLGSALVAAGLSWPTDEDGRKDIWIKLKSLVQGRRG
ncbi:hypothetical protein CROQUDRAFT_654047 [Cronartium quercuum f. sp. fusiforme G11]|uniref:F-box domain-containing protein n=1 Tax=Cronartium quercuum f. sp. fusiforme G11 TaxID=708437 RepID=A0A9P6NNV2_9BASI|nr:hypothetical protein CROQUDRAFT_654047 [Cronartium quercuum f. sp. fusiforme G11]